MPDTWPLQIKRAFYFLDYPGLDSMGINHRCSHITVSQKFLNRPDIIIRLEKVTCKAMAKNMRCCPLIELLFEHDDHADEPGDILSFRQHRS